MRTARRAPRQLAPRLLLVVVLALGMVAMHHLAGAGSDEPAPQGMVAAMDDDRAPAGHGAKAADDDGAGHGLFHLCLAVLSAAVLLLAGWLLLGPRRWTALAPPGASLAPPAPARPPPRPHGAALLVSLCVMRT
ncbi:DUF6153 family protein [Jiangella endophytica]|uniref:DUF6153 family protein n=1 Tax=Jiangella endophytica TaxID=1623398 RepID=UPI000E353DCA|nr:DUF6153 family protein [Jiangella endophytica]